MSVNINVIGRLGVDAEIKESAKGQFVTYRMAVDEWNPQTKSRETIWFRVTDFSPRSVTIAEHLKKGRQVYVSGTENCNLYTDKEGKTQISREITAYVTDFVNSGNSGQTATQTTVTTTSTATTPSAPAAPMPPLGMGSIPQPVAVAAGEENDDLPF